MRKLIFLLIIAGLFAAGFLIWGSREKPEPLTGKENLIKVSSPKADEAISSPLKIAGEARKLYYYNQNLDADESGNIACSRRGLVSVDRIIPKTQTPIQDTIKLLLSGKLKQEELAQGISTEYPLDGVSLRGASLKDGNLTLEFEDIYNKTGGGSCRVGILWFQIEATAKQFPEVKEVRFLPEELFQP